MRKIEIGGERERVEESGEGKERKTKKETRQGCTKYGLQTQMF